MDRALRILTLVALALAAGFVVFILLATPPSTTGSYVTFRTLEGLFGFSVSCLWVAVGAAALVACAQRRQRTWFAVLAILLLVAIYARFLFDVALSGGVQNGLILLATRMFGLNGIDIVSESIFPLPLGVALLMYAFARRATTLPPSQ